MILSDDVNDWIAHLEGRISTIFRLPPDEQGPALHILMNEAKAYLGMGVFDALEAGASRFGRFVIRRLQK